ncbi:DNA polymerase epsilon subunit 1 [Fonticula alba]|uniref:DNA polymerase epsilon catalytic subunit n=1 Tax=Fonticula alba TaxID=691883 RepID=A0A058Z2V1_FONAL|nr:DNA polymerase epsilon subunit 1 [Fonticula alba]KCV68263.1 DNA polymerase epsilon subunit 1 [Fonticula alba]|eukprot:XP_009497317.1 DNA polymerase epsilon subunit 1 [Fonticula alba]
MSRGRFGQQGGRGGGSGGAQSFGGGGRSFAGQRGPRGAFEDDAPADGDQRFDLFESRFAEIEKSDAIDAKFGYVRLEDTDEPELGWLLNMHETTVRDPDWPSGRSAVDFYFLKHDGSRFKATLTMDPYFYLRVASGMEVEVEQFLLKKFENVFTRIVHVYKEDLSQPNHLTGIKVRYLQLFFRNTTDATRVRRWAAPLVARNAERRRDASAGGHSLLAAGAGSAAAEALGAASASASASGALDLGAPLPFTDSRAQVTSTRAGLEKTGGRPAAGAVASLYETVANVQAAIIDIREYDIPYYLRAAIDLDIRVGFWYSVSIRQGAVSLHRNVDLVERADAIVLAFDIECTKQPLKFPDARTDGIMMISYMIDKQGYLITNREVVSADIDDFEYTPVPEYEGPFIIFNEPDEEALLRRFLEHIQEVRPSIIASFNGDFFDWPFLEARLEAFGINMFEEIGFAQTSAGGEYFSRHCAHMDAFRWVQRDSYLPAGSHGLKAVTTALLGYNPVELDPEQMTPFAVERPHELATYSVSDAVATFYLYMKYVHPFIFSLCNIIPLCADEVLRKGSGTLCETLLMAQSFKLGIIMPNKQVDELGRTFNGHLLETETYVGGHVEAIESGVFRSDIPMEFDMDATAFQELIDGMDETLAFGLQGEGASLDEVTNLEEVKAELTRALSELRDAPRREILPLIYHLDVAAMYPNIILTNRLQPPALIDETTCASCDFNVPGSGCQREMEWQWRGEYFPANKGETELIRAQMETETFPSKFPDMPPQPFTSLPAREQAALLSARLGDYSRKVYKRTHITRVETRKSIVCQRENSFYVDTVRAFRDRRYDYKVLHKKWGNIRREALASRDMARIEESEKMVVIYDSLQLAHKVILNSFYGYVMRKAARWYSMEMAGIVCHTGANIIRMAHKLVDRIGRPLELDTDGIWCVLPAGFPENVSLKLKSGKSVRLSFPCSLLNHMVNKEFTNHQYQTLVDPERLVYATSSENSIFFEIDGPYRAMILPSSTEKDKKLKKRYAVFHPSGKLAELKGFEIKRRGELQLIKTFQSQLFERFLGGRTLAECYEYVAVVANNWLDVLYSKARDMEDSEVIDLLSENRSMSRTLEDYGNQKSTSISTARRLAEFLGDQMVKDKGLSCQFIISTKPLGTPVTERAVPVAIFSAEEHVKRHYLRKWLKDPSLNNFDIRSLLDWEYYIERFGAAIQKLITIPAAYQNVANPVPRVRHPDWLQKQLAEKHGCDAGFRQRRITDMFTKGEPGAAIPDIEDLGTGGLAPGRMIKRKRMPAGSDGQGNDEGPEAGSASEAGPDTVPIIAPQADALVDYRAWLVQAKEVWRHRRRNPPAAGPEASDPGASIVMAPSMKPSYFRRQADALRTRTWEILQICETPTPGEFNVFAFVGETMNVIKVNVPRIFYVNSLVDDPSTSAKRVQRTLPHGAPTHFLHEYRLPEADFIENRHVCAHPPVGGLADAPLPSGLLGRWEFIHLARH